MRWHDNLPQIKFSQIPSAEAENSPEMGSKCGGSQQVTDLVRWCNELAVGDVRTSVKMKRKEERDHEDEEKGSEDKP